MGRENQKDIALFSEQIDLLVSGGEVEKSPAMGEAINEALDFARKLIVATPGPSHAFEARLRARLLQKLAENEIARERRDWRMFVRQPVWQAAGALVLIVLVGAVVWGSGILDRPEPLITSSTLQVAADTDRSNYVPGEPVEIDVTLKNVTAAPLEIEQFPPIMSVMQADSRQPVFTFGAGHETRTLMPGEAVTFAVSWDQRDETGKRVAGEYYLELEDINLGSQAIKLTFSRPVTFDIRSGDTNIGEIYGTMDTGRSETVDGITVILGKLELAEKGARLSAVVPLPPGYDQNQPAGDFTAFATYYFDRGWGKSAELASVEYHRTEIKLTWYLTGPVPSETEELLFLIMNIGQWEGLWQFVIPLGR